MDKKKHHDDELVNESSHRSSNETNDRREWGMKSWKSFFFIFGCWGERWKIKTGSSQAPAARVFFSSSWDKLESDHNDLVFFLSIFLASSLHIAAVAVTSAEIKKILHISFRFTLRAFVWAGFNLKSVKIIYHLLGHASKSQIGALCVVL